MPMKRIAYLTIPLLAFFSLMYPFLPETDISIHSSTTRLYLSVSVFGFILILLYLYTQFMVPFVFGITPILHVLRNSGATYGGGVELFYLTSMLIILSNLPRYRGIAQIKVKGLIPISLFLMMGLIHICWSKTRYLEFQYLEFARISTFIMMVYYFSNRIERGLFQRILYSVAVGNTLVLMWILAKTPYSGFLESRLGETVGVNPNMTGMYAFLVTVAFIFIIIQEKAKLRARHLVFLLGPITIIFLSGSKAAIWQFIIFTPLILIKFREHASIKFVYVTALALVLISGIIIFLGSKDRLGGVFEALGESYQFGRVKNLDRSSRLYRDELSWKLANQYPVLGIGMGNYTKFSGIEGIFDTFDQPAYHHNAIAGTAAECGYLGLVLFSLWYLRLLSTRKPGSKWSQYIVTLAACAMVGGITHGSFLHFHGGLLFFIGIAMENTLLLKKFEMDSQARPPSYNLNRIINPNIVRRSVGFS